MAASFSTVVEAENPEGIGEVKMFEVTTLFCVCLDFREKTSIHKSSHLTARVDSRIEWKHESYGFVSLGLALTSGIEFLIKTTHKNIGI